MDTLAPLLPVLSGLALLGVGLFGALTRRRLDVLPVGLFVAGLGVALLAVGFGEVTGARRVASHVARCALALAVVQAIVSLALARSAASRIGATTTDDLERLRG